MIGSAESKNEAGETLWNNVVKLDFAKKYSLVEPFFSVYSSKEAAGNPWKINDLRNAIFHGRAIKEAKFQGKLICDESTVENIFLVAQATCRNFDKFEEMLDAPHALADRWRKRLEELHDQSYDAERFAVVRLLAWRTQFSHLGITPRPSSFV